MKNQMLESHRICVAVLLLVVASLFYLPASQAQSASKIFKPTTVKYQDEAGAVHVAILGARHLDEVVGELQPTFEMNERIALERSMPVTLSYYNEAISSFKAALKIALPGTSTTSSETTNSDGTNTTTNASSTKARIPGDLSSVPSEAALRPDLHEGGVPYGALGTEALTQYQVARTLFQEIKLMNRALKDLSRPTNYEPYVVTLQVSLMPFRRGLRYDAYSTLSFFPDGMMQSVPAKLLESLQTLIIDLKKGEYSDSKNLMKAVGNFELMEKQAAIDAVPLPSQGGFYRPFKALDNVSKSFSFKGIENPTKQEFEEWKKNTLLSLDDHKADLEELHRNSLAQVQPIIAPLLATDNLEVSDNDRILNQIRQFNLALAGMFSGVGASLGLDSFKQNLEGVNGRDLNGLMTLGRLNDSTLRVRLGAMLQSRSEFAMVPRTHNIAIIILIPKGASELSVYSRTSLKETVTGKELLQRNPSVLHNKFKAIVSKYHSDAKVDKKSVDTVLKPIIENDFNEFSKQLSGVAPSLTNFSRILWAEFSEIYVGSQYGAARATLPKPPMFQLDDSNRTAQTLIAIDDGTSSTVVIKNGKFPSATGVKAALTIPGTHSRILYHDSIESLSSGAALRIKFPSLKSSNLLGKDANGKPITEIPLSLKLNLPKLANPAEFSSIQLVLKGEDRPTPAFQVTASQGYLVAGENGSRKFTLTVQKSKEAAPGNYFLRVEGPVVSSVTSPGAQVTLAADGSIQVAGDMVLTFEFEYLLPNAEVSFVLLKSDDKGGKVIVDTIKKERVAAIAAPTTSLRVGN